MTITLNNLGKKFNKEWIFRGVNFQFDVNKPVAIVGNNGSGKSTLLQLVGSLTYSSEGSIEYKVDGKILHPDKVYQYMSFAGPYQELMEELSLKEHVEFHLKFRKLINNISVADFINKINLGKHADKSVYQFSSGMKQRLKLGLAILSDTPLLLLDEPISNLDAETILWYRNLLSENVTNRTLIISSNHNTDEIFICNQQIDVREYKNS